MNIGYARVSTQDQNLELQLSALKKYGCEQIFKEKASSVKDRSELDKMLTILRKGDSIIVWKLDRLGRSLRHLVNLLNEFSSKGVEFVSLSDNIDTSTAQGRLIFNLFASFAEFERELISERTKAGMKAARAKGHFAGRKPGLSKEAKKTANAAYLLSQDDSLSVGNILKQLDISKTSYYRYVKWAKEERYIKSSVKD